MMKYDYIFDMIMNIIKKVKQQDHKLGALLEESISFDMETGNIKYRGTIIETILKKSIIKDTN